MLRDVLQGKPLRHPLHTLIVHFPIALFTLTLVLDLASHAFEGQGLARAAFYALAAALVGSLLAAVPGFVDYSEIRDDHPAKRTATAHMMLNLVMLALYAASFGLRWKHLDVPSTPVLPLLVSVAGFVVLGFSGYLGGRLVYDDGIAVGRHRHEGRIPQHTIGIAVPPGRTDELRFVPIAAERDLQNGETIRAEIGDFVMCITRIDTKVYAYQEFCTHRFGPLSESCVRGTEIECPWHRSRFDVRNGKVVHGPAKVDLKTWPVEIRDGQICVGIAGHAKLTQPELLPRNNRRDGTSSG